MDVAVVVNPATGKLTFARNSDGDFYFDDRAIGPVFGTLFAEKGRYLWDATVGTTISTVTKDGRATGTRIAAAATEALRQVKVEGLITSYDVPVPTMLRGGVWQLTLRWQTPSGPQKLALKV